ncbi:MAG: hypothetical protein AAB953_01155 [Patescibacteria group bacterium]
MTGQNQSQSVEVAGFARPEGKETNLSPTAQLVNFMMREYVMPELRGRGLVTEANEIIEAKLSADDPRIIEFSIKCREVQAAIQEKAEKEGRNQKELAVISNYFAKLINSVKNLQAQQAAPAEKV